MTLVSLCVQTDFGGIFEIIHIYEHYDHANEVQIEQCWVIHSQTVPYSKPRKWKQKVLQTKQREVEKLREYIPGRQKGDDSWLSAIWTKIAFIKGRLNLCTKSTTVANVHLMESLLLDNWLRNNHVTVEKIYRYSITFAVCLCLRFYMSFTCSFQTYFSTAVFLILEGANTLSGIK